MKAFIIKIFTIFLSVGLLLKSDVFAQDSQVEKQAWGMAFFNWRLNEKWIYNQDVAIMHSFEEPAFTRFFLRSQINRQFSGIFSAHGGVIYIYSQNPEENDAIELRPWAGAKVRWPSLWRFDFVHYLRLEQRFRHTMGIDDWSNDFRMRYKLSSNLPINHESLTDNTLYGVLGYEFYSESFDVDVRFTRAAIHRFDGGLGFRQNIKNSYEATVVLFKARDEVNNNYALSSVVLFLKYKHFINWQ